MSEVLSVAQAPSKDQPRITMHAIVNQFECDQNIICGDLFSQPMGNLNINLWVLANSVLIIRGLAGSSYTILILLFSLGIRVFDIFPDRDACLIPKFLEVLAELISCFLEFSPSALIRENEKVFDKVHAAQDICRHFVII